MSLDAQAIYELLPAIYRTRDEAAAPEGQEGPLKALLSVIAEQVAALEENLEQLHDDQFIETCAEWVVPYIADLVGYRALEPGLQREGSTARAEVADTIRLRRRKGTAEVLKVLAEAVTGWDAAVAEFFRRLATTQYLNHLRPENEALVDVRRAERLEALGTPFDTKAHTADVRRIASRRGRHNIPNVGIFLWPVGALPWTDVPAARVDDRRYRFNPLGTDTQLYQKGSKLAGATGTPDAIDAPLPITRRGLRRDLTELYGVGRSLTVSVDGTMLGAAEVEACDLSDTGPDPQTSAWAHAGQTRAAIDPVLGRLVLAQPTTKPVRVTFHYGAVAGLGGGEYAREPGPAATHRVPAPHASIPAALAAAGGRGVVEIARGDVIDATPELAVAAGAALRLRARDAVRPLVRLGGNLVVHGDDSGEVVLEGLLITGGAIEVPAQTPDGRPNRLEQLTIVDCTVAPGGVALEVAAPNVEVLVERSIVGGIRVLEEATVTVRDSIVDAGGSEQIAYAGVVDGQPGGPLQIHAATVLGKLHAAELTAGDAILHAARAAADTWPAAVVVERRQAGHVRWSHVPPGSQLPRRYACTPEDGGATPWFRSTRFGDAGYFRLHPGCTHRIRCGASDGGEMGAHHRLGTPQRVAGLGVRLDEYLRFGLEAGIFLES